LLLSWTKSSAATGDSCHVHSSLPLTASDQVQGVGNSKSEVETDVAALELETSATTLELDTNTATLELETDVATLDLEIETELAQEISQQSQIVEYFTSVTVEKVIIPLG
jgi:hypothetical protein